MREKVAVDRNNPIKLIRLSTAPTLYSITIVCGYVMIWTVVALFIGYIICRVTPIDNYISPTIVNMIIFTFLLRSILDRLGLFTEVSYIMYVDKVLKNGEDEIGKYLCLRGESFLEKKLRRCRDGSET